MTSNEQESQNPVGNKRAVIVTVHGTFARKARWSRADSTLARALLTWFADRGITATVVPFQWSGRNSVVARRSAGAELAEYLERVHRDDPGASLYVIAHSHGGSVLAYAMKFRPELADKIDGFVALATPWMGVAPSSFSSALRLLIGKLRLFAAFAASLFVLPYVVQWLLRVTTGRPMVIELPSVQSSAAPQGPPGPIYSVDLPDFYVDPLYVWAPILAAVAVAIVLFFPLQRLVARRLEDSTATFQRKLLNISKDSSTLNERLPPSVFLKPIGDEAALALTLSSALTSLAQSITTLLFVSMQWTRDRWMSLPRLLRVFLALLFLAVWAVGTMEVEKPFINLYRELTMTPITNIR